MTLTIKCVALTNSNCLTIALGLENLCYHVHAVSTDKNCFHYTYWIFLTPLNLLMCENRDKFKLEVSDLKVWNLKVSPLFELFLLASGCLSLTQESVYGQQLQWFLNAFFVVVVFLNGAFVRAGEVSMKEYLSFVLGECYCINDLLV